MGFDMIWYCFEKFGFEKIVEKGICVKDRKMENNNM